MSSPVVSIPGVGSVQFPSTMSQQDINAAAHRLYTDAASKQISANPPSVQAPTPEGLQGAPTNNYQAVPAEQTAAGNTAAAESRIGDGPLDQIAAGFAKSAGQSVENTVGRVLPGQAPDKSALQPNGGLQDTGALGESVLEAIAADEGFKSLGVIDKIKSLGTVSDLMAKHPLIAKALGSGLLNAASGAVTQGVKTGTAEGAEEGAIAGGVAGAALPLAGAAAGKLKSAASDLWQTASGKAIQTDLQSGIKSVLSDAADTAEVDAPTTTSIRKSAASLAENVEFKSKGLFQQIDDATDGEATNLQNKIKNVDFKLRDIAGTDDTLEDKLTQQKTALESRFDDVLTKAQENGVSQDTIDTAKQTWKQSSALRDLDTQIKASTAGNVKNAPEVVDPNKLVGRIQKLADSGRLEEALGSEHADSFLQTAYDAQKSLKNRGTAIKVIKGVAKGGAVAGAIGYGAHSVLGGAAE